MDGILAEAASARRVEDVMAAALGGAIQESVMGDASQTTGNDDIGIFQQGRNWMPRLDTVTRG